MALLDNGKQLKKGDVLKIGQARNLAKRWQSIASIFEPDRKLRNNVKNDVEKWLNVANGEEVSVWMKEAGKIEIPYAKGLTQSLFSTKGPEEEFIDQYYEPRIGRPLNRKATEETD